MTNQTRDVRTLLVLRRGHGTEELRVKLCESQSPQGLRLFVELRTYANTATGAAAPTKDRVYIHTHEIDEVINALEVALEDISRAKYTLRPKE